MCRNRCTFSIFLVQHFLLQFICWRMKFSTSSHMYSFSSYVFPHVIYLQFVHTTVFFPKCMKCFLTYRFSSSAYKTLSLCVKLFLLVHLQSLTSYIVFSPHYKTALVHLYRVSVHLSLSTLCELLVHIVKPLFNNAKK